MRQGQEYSPEAIAQHISHGMCNTLRLPVRQSPRSKDPLATSTTNANIFPIIARPYARCTLRAAKSAWAKMCDNVQNRTAVSWLSIQNVTRMLLKVTRYCPIFAVIARFLTPFPPLTICTVPYSFIFAASLISCVPV